MPRAPLLTTTRLRLSVSVMFEHTPQYELSPDIFDAARRWLAPVRSALGEEFLAAMLTGSVLRPGFDASRSRVNLLLVARSLALPTLDSLAAAVASAPIGRVRFEPLFVTRAQIEASLDVFPIEWLDIQERHQVLAGDDLFATIIVPRGNLRLQCEHELRGKHLRLRQAYLALAHDPDRLHEALAQSASSFHTLFRTLLRLSGEHTPAAADELVPRIAERFGLESAALLGAYRARHTDPARSADDTRSRFLGFLAEIERLVAAIDGLPVS